MPGDPKFLRESASILEEIEEQLEGILKKKRQEVEQELEQKIQEEQKEAQKKINEIEKNLSEEKRTLVGYRAFLSDFDSQKANLKNQIKSHLEKAEQFQEAISSLTGKTLDELKKVSDLHRNLEELNKEAIGKIISLKKELEEKYGVETRVPERSEEEDVDFDLESELSKLKKIKELLGAEEIPEKLKEPGPENGQEQLAEEEDFGQTIPEEPEVPQEAEDVQEPVSLPEEETEEESAPEAQRMIEGTFQDAFDILEKHRKSIASEENGEVVCYKYEGRVILDGETIMSEINNNIEEAKKHYIKLSQTASLKEQFFIKQDIIRFQEILRKLMLNSLKMCEKGQCSLPKFTSDLMNVDVLKDILEKVSMENWSNEEEFKSFVKFFNALKNAYSAKITPPREYLTSLIEELGIEE